MKYIFTTRTRIIKPRSSVANDRAERKAKRRKKCSKTS